MGEPGIGKNALLSNWVKRRAGTKHRDEFLFQYFAGASTRAKQLPHMLQKVGVVPNSVQLKMLPPCYEYILQPYGRSELCLIAGVFGREATYYCTDSTYIARSS